LQGERSAAFLSIEESVLSLKRQKKKKGGAAVGLEIEAGSVAAAEVHVNGSPVVTGAAVEALSPGAFHEGEIADPDSVTEALKSLFGSTKLSKQVRVGVGNQKVIVRTLRLPVIEDPKEMDAAVRFQAQEEIPMPLDQAVLEHQVVGGVPAEEGATPQVDVIVVAARRDMVSSFLEPVRRAGLEPVAVDLSAFGMIRALSGLEPEAAAGTADAEAPTMPVDDAVLYCSVGDVLNLAVARGRACLFNRVAGTGLQSISGRLATEQGLSPEHASQWLSHVGLEQPVDQIEGDPNTVAAARAVLEDGARALVEELRLSLDYYGAQESAVPVGRVVLSGQGSAVAGLPGKLQEGLGLPISVARPTALAGYDESTAARLTLPYGLALEA
jgi:type IV pilus assembly protein PilM